MSQSHPVSNPFGAGPSYGASDANNPFQIVGGGQPGPPPQSPSPPGSSFGQAPSQAPLSGNGAKAQVPVSRPAPAPESNPFQIVEGRQVPVQEGAQAAPPQRVTRTPGGRGFEMTGLPPGGPPVNQLDAAPVGGGDGDQPPVAADPFAGMDLPQVSEETDSEAPAEAVSEEAPVADFAVAEPAAAPQAPPKQAAKPEPASFVPVKPGGGEAVTHETKQLELRAIFGVDHELSAQEILQRARGLPGILQVAKVTSKEAAGLEALQGCATKLGLDEEVPIVMSCPDGFIDFVHTDETALAVLRREDYGPGVRATLIIVARELGKL